MKDFSTLCKNLNIKIWYFKSHGEPMQTRGIPDIVMCFEGIFVGWEFKVMRRGQMNITPYQEQTLEEILTAKGIPMLIWWNEKNATVGIQTTTFETIHHAVIYVIREMSAIKKTIICGVEK